MSIIEKDFLELNTLKHASFINRELFFLKSIFKNHPFSKVNYFCDYNKKI